MDAFQTARLLMGLAVGELILTILYALQSILYNGNWLVLGTLALLSASLFTLALSVWGRATSSSDSRNDEQPIEP